MCNVESRESIETRLAAFKKKWGSKLKCHKDYNPHPAHQVPYSWYMQKVLRRAVNNGVIM